jgi:glycosyltransferase involved in cell wall biosynthesis
VFTRAGNGVANAKFAQEAVLSDDAGANARALGRFDVDLWIHLNAGLAPLAQRLRAPSFAYFHGNDFLNPWLACGPAVLERVRRPYAAAVRNPLRRAAIRRAAPALRCVFVNSTRTAQLVRARLALPESKVKVCWPGVDDLYFRGPRPETPRHAPRNARNGGGGVRVLTVANLNTYVRRKNVDGVLHAIKLLEGEVDVHYTVVGDGTDRPRLETLAEELGIAGRVRFVGRLDAESLLACYADADLFVLAAKATENDVEGFGIVYLEASAAGVPSICSAEGGSVDAVREGVNGIVIERSTPDCIARAIAAFAREPHRFDRAALRTFAEQFRWPRVAERMAAEIDALLGAGPVRTAADTA